MKKVFALVFVCLSSLSFAQVNFGEVVGEVRDVEVDEAIIDAHVFIDADGKRYQTKTDLDGRFRISAIPSGIYEMKIKYGKDTITVAGVDVPIDGFFNTGVIDFANVIVLPDAVVTPGVRLISGDLPVRTITSEEISESSVKFDINSLVASVSSDVTQTADGKLAFRGARVGDVIYIVDGVKTRDLSSMPSVAIGRMQVYSGAIPAKYGDTNGGVVVIESKSYFDLYRAWKAHQ